MAKGRIPDRLAMWTLLGLTAAHGLLLGLAGVRRDPDTDAMHERFDQRLEAGLSARPRFGSELDFVAIPAVPDDHNQDELALDLANQPELGNAQELSDELDHHEAQDDIQAPSPQAAELGSGKVELHICNRSQEQKVYAAIAAYDPALQRLVARGWFPQLAGKCQAVMRGLVPPIYVFAESSDGQRQWRDERGAAFCIRGDAAFVTSPSRCAGQSRRFRRLELRPGQSVQTWSIEDGVKS